MSTSSPDLARSLPPHAASEAGPAWKQELNERLAATRARGARKRAEQTVLPGLEPSLKHGSEDGLEQIEGKADSRASRLAAKVAERYAKAPAYSEILAARARMAALAETAGQEIHAAAPPVSPSSLASSPDCDPDRCVDRPGAGTEEAETAGALPAEISPPAAAPIEEAPVEEALVLPALPLPANLIEFPRELVAARRARPRLAEGPLRETPEEAAHDQSQLRIFEVAPDAISKTVNLNPAATEWSSIRLDAKSASASGSEEQASASLDLPLQPAPLEDRLMATIFDIALVLVAFLLFVLVFAACTAHPPSGKPAWVAAGLLVASLFLLYQYLFFKYAEGTPGMRYAKIALCTFDDENPTRKAMRRRLLAWLLSAAPLGLGFAWAWFDTDRLGWHDRIMRMYQRSYR